MNIEISEVLYKKAKGTLILGENNIKWIELGKQLPTLIISLDSIKNLQATPITNPKVMIKIFEKTQDNETISYIFTFVSPKARNDCNSFKLNIQKVISEKKYERNIHSISDILTKDDFEQDIDLQQSLLKNNSDLMKTFSESVIKGSLTNEQFWSTRIHLLRTYAAEKYQKRGPYNVLVTIRPQTTDNRIKLSLSREKIHDIFQQHPLIKHVYNENVPPLSEDDFWGRFFLSRLCKKLRGEKQSANDPNDEILDKYIDYEDNLFQSYTNNTKDISHFIDLTRNEHHIEKAFDFEPSITLRGLENIQVLQSLNKLSIKMMNYSKKQDITFSNKKKKYNNNNFHINLNDLQKKKNENSIYLYIKGQKEYFIGNDIFQENYPKKIKKPKLYIEFGTTKYQSEPTMNINNNDILKDTTYDILRKIKPDSQTKHSFETVIPLDIKNQIILCHRTANEFLNQFWLRFLSNEKTITSQLPQIINSLKKTNNRINAIIKSGNININSLEAIRNYFKPTVFAIMKALEKYQDTIL